MSFRFNRGNPTADGRPVGSALGTAGGNDEFAPPMCRICRRQDGEDGADLTLVAPAGVEYECDNGSGCRDPQNTVRPVTP